MKKEPTIQYYANLQKHLAVAIFCKFDSSQANKYAIWQQIMIPSRPNYTKNVYFSMITGDSMSASQIQLANIYNIKGTALLINEIVIINESYTFERFDPGIY